ncbi:MAG: peptidase family, partial [Candidatus Binatus sp.]|nr:peptidase family [Candidatus Binatus sp.]
MRENRRSVLKTPHDLILIVGTALALGIASTAMRAMVPAAHAGIVAETVAVRGNRPAAISSLSSRLSADRQLHVTIKFALRNRDALTTLMAEQQDPASPRYHHWLTPQQFNARFGQSSAEVAALSDWLTGQGFQLRHASAREISADVSATQAEIAFSTTIASSSDEAVFANLTEPQIPARFAGLIASVEGLDNTTHWQALAVGPLHQAEKGKAMA